MSSALVASSGVVDLHVHVFEEGFLPQRQHEGSARVAAGARPGGAPQSWRELEAERCDPSGSGMLADLERNGVSHAVLMMLDSGIAYGEAARGPEEVMDRHAAIVAGSEGRLSAFAGIDPRRPTAAKLLRRAVTELGFVGLKAYPPHGYRPDDPEPMALYREAADLGVPVLFHAGYVQPPGRSAYAHPVLIEGVQAALPDLTIIIGHAGFDLWWRDAARVVEGHDKTYLEFSQWDRVGRTDEARLREVMLTWKRICGSHRLLFGSDHVSSSDPARADTRQSWWLDWLRRLPETTREATDPFTAADLDLMLGDNARRIFHA